MAEASGKTPAGAGTAQSAAVAPVVQDSWQRLKAFTDARIALGRSGVSQPTAAHLRFSLDHARARDAVHLPLDQERLFAELADLGLAVVPLSSRARERREYLLRPDLGRRLDAGSVKALRAGRPGDAPRDVALVVSDGLSSAAIQRQAAPFLAAFLPLAAAQGLSLSAVHFVSFGRVAVGDEVGELLGARAVVVLIGERPGLSSPDSMGIYMTHGPEVGLTDERRNCISNVRPEGQPHAAAATTLAYLLEKSLRLGLSGVNLKDDQALPGAKLPAEGPGLQE
ncbi:Ethanolamine ammonia-lyase light chain [Desulfovibrio sp. X2]|uniref:ethanolamine ammonia-lyase subunit EutC n=1 Tax=Desulfovibrio sp. X2 TaxID=941449 RepID=UPI00035882FF|nr:ethanolamine ammonia-lyase subunit EutC [Desulfovibrio sp. X2]EPR41606.1 Ethanolamine ammonia-lyase light chain [Desulfovibrio sp. X2]